MTQWRCGSCGRYTKRGYLMCRPCRRILEWLRRELNGQYIN